MYQWSRNEIKSVSLEWLSLPIKIL
jgi:hypothetical protein